MKSSIETRTVADAVRSYIARLPKAELHLHLEGSVTPRLLARLARRHDTDYASWQEQEIAEQLFQYEDFYAFLDTYGIVCRHLRGPEDYALVLEELVSSFRDQGIAYAEISFTPSIAWKFEADGEAILDLLLENSRRLEAEHGIVLRWILDCVRQWGAGPAWRTARLAADRRDQGVVALGLGGDEKSLHLETYREVFDWARAHQLYAYVHAGEIGEPEQVWGALEILGANRIAHGIQAARDSRLIEHLRERAVALDICLTSNLMTGAWAPISENPFGLLLKRGVLITLGSDDPGLFHTNLTEELVRAAHFFDLGRDDIERVILQGVNSSFLPHDEKMALMHSFHARLQSSREPGS